jgi:hypothetical protein
LLFLGTSFLKQRLNQSEENEMLNAPSELETQELRKLSTVDDKQHNIDDDELPYLFFEQVLLLLFLHFQFNKTKFLRTKKKTGLI